MSATAAGSGDPGLNPDHTHLHCIQKPDVSRSVAPPRGGGGLSAVQAFRIRETVPTTSQLYEQEHY